MPIRLAVVFGTYNRLELLKRAVHSVRAASGSLEVTMIVVDGGSTDGSRAWLAEQPDVVLLGQRGPLTGAVRAFNLGFGYAVDHDFPYVMHLNDDAEVAPLALDGGGTTLERAVDLLVTHPTAGEVAFAFDLRGKYAFEAIHGKVYANFGIVRREAGMAVARAQGDPSGRAWWNPIYVTYAADCEFGAWLHKLGWAILADQNLRVHDLNAQDELRKNNAETNAALGNSELFWQRWPNAASMQPDAGVVVPSSGPAAEVWPPDVNWQGAKVHLGCGTHRLQGWVNVDGLKTPATDVVLDFSSGLPFVPNGALQAIYWSHGPEHIHADLLPGLLRDLRRVLAKGGELIVAAPDFEGIYKHRFASNANGSAWLAAIYGECTSTDHPFLAHKQCFTAETMEQLLREAGFENVRSWAPSDYPEIARVRDYAVTCELVSCLMRGSAGEVATWEPMSISMITTHFRPIEKFVSPRAFAVAPSFPAVDTSTPVLRQAPDMPSGVERAVGYPDPTLLVPPAGKMSPLSNMWHAGERVLHVALRDLREGQPGLARALRSITTRGDAYADVDWIAAESRGGDHLVNEVLGAAQRLKPTIVFMQLQRQTAITRAVVAKIREVSAQNVVIINWDGDQHFEPRDPQRNWFVELGHACDTSLVVNTKHPAEYRMLGVVRPGFLEIGVDGEIYKPNTEVFQTAAPSVVLLASNYSMTPAYGPRLHVVRELQSGMGAMFGVYGNGWRGWASGHPCLNQADEAARYRSCVAAISMSIRNDLPRYTSDRLFRALSCGALVLVERFVDMEGLGIQSGVNAFAWDTVDELKALVGASRDKVTEGWLASHETMGRVRGQAAALGRLHTWDARMLELMMIVQTVRQSKSWA